jgi:signal transduction histidine kinase
MAAAPRSITKAKPQGASSVLISPSKDFSAHISAAIRPAILIVDDDQRNLFALAEMLGDLGHDLISASSGREALRCLLERDVALILMDVQMPGMDGYETVELIRARERCRHVPIIFITAFSKDDQQVFRGYSAGAVDYVFKPIDALILKSKVSVFIDLYRKTEEIRRQAELEKALLQENFRVRAEKLRSEQALRRRDEQYSLIINSMPLVLYSLMPTEGGHKLRFVSENIEAITGFPAQRFLEDENLWRSRLHEEDRARVLAELGELARPGIRSREYRWICADGGVKHFLDSTTSRQGERGVEILGSWLDISERRQLEIELQRAQRLEAIGRLTGGIAHDFNNMLSVVISSLDMLKLRVAGTETERYGELALKGALRCADLTQRLLTFARRQPLQSRVFDLGEFVGGMVDLLSRMLGETIEVTCEKPDEPVTILADPAHVEAALLNLIFNARDAMPKGGSLAVTVAPAEFGEQSPTGCSPGRYVALGVADSGHGMPPEVMARVFEPFFTTKGVGRGTGLGLSTTYGFVKQLGGHIDIKSRVGEGTVVTLYFPAAPDEAGDVPTSVAGNAAAPRLAGTVLVVEDEDDVREMAVAALRDMGAATLEARDGPTALDLIDKHREIEVMFTDVMMPGMTGGELSAEARCKRPDLKILFTSGYGDLAALDGAQGEVLRKPYRAHQLVEQMAQLLAN